MLNIECFFSGKIPKEQESDDDCQDQFLVKGNCLALADGASQSFYSSIWAKLLVENFCHNPDLNKDNWQSWLLSIQQDWLSLVKQRVEIAKSENKPEDSTY